MSLAEGDLDRSLRCLLSRVVHAQRGLKLSLTNESTVRLRSLERPLREKLKTVVINSIVDLPQKEIQVVSGKSYEMSMVSIQGVPLIHSTDSQLKEQKERN